MLRRISDMKSNKKRTKSNYDRNSRLETFKGLFERMESVSEKYKNRRWTMYEYVNNNKKGELDMHHKSVFAI